MKAARSVELASERLGITAKLDLLEGTGGGVVPVDTKKGRPAPGGRPWEADAVQVCAQVLLLREHGYAVEHGEIFYARDPAAGHGGGDAGAGGAHDGDRRRGAGSRDPAGAAPAAAVQPEVPALLAGRASACPDEVNVLAARQDSRAAAADRRPTPTPCRCT